jgi:hypothetical protein
MLLVGMINPLRWCLRYYFLKLRASCLKSKICVHVNKNNEIVNKNIFHLAINIFVNNNNFHFTLQCIEITMY